MNRLNQRIWIIVICLALLLGTARSPVSAQSADSGLKITGAIIDLVVKPGQTYVHPIIIASGSQNPPMDITVEASGFGQNLNGTFEPLPANQDSSPYTGRSLITNISNSSFHIDPGGTVTVNVTLSIPQDFGATTRYAIVYIYTQPIGSGNSVGQVLTVTIPVILTPDGASFTTTGAITNLQVSPVVSGQPLIIQTTVKNTGNRHFKMKGQVTITGPDGNVFATLDIPLTGTSVIPTFSRLLTASYGFLDPSVTIKTGTYTVLSKVFREDGSLVDSKSTTFSISQPYQVCPGIDPSNMMVASFKGQDPGTVNARDKTDVSITFEGAGVVTGQVAICKYSAEPAGTPGFTDPISSGGTGQAGIKFVLVRVDGFSQGVAHLLMGYKPAELGSIKPDSLYLAYKGPNSWLPLDNMEVQTGAQVVLGDIRVANLVNGVVMGMGGGGALPTPTLQPTLQTTNTSATTAPTPALQLTSQLTLAPTGETSSTAALTQQPAGQSGLASSWQYLCLVGLLLLVILVLIVILLRRRKPSQEDQDHP